MLTWLSDVLFRPSQAKLSTDTGFSSTQPAGAIPQQLVILLLFWPVPVFSVAGSGRGGVASNAHTWPKTVCREHRGQLRARL